MTNAMDKWDGETIELGGKDKAAVLAALYNGCVGCRRIMDQKEAQSLLDSGHKQFAVIDGLTLKVDLRGTSVWSVLYDQVNGKGAMRKALEKAGLL